MKTESSLNPEFDAYAEQYDAALQKGLAISGENKDFYARGRMQWLAGRLKGLSASPESALDFGCGTGTSAPLLLGLGGIRSVLGVDVSERSIELASKTLGSEQIQFGLIKNWPPKATFDLAFCNGVFHHIPPSSRAEAFSYVLQSLRPGGLFAFWENNPWNPGTRLVMRRIPFDKDAITLSPVEARKSLMRAGFEVICTDFLFFFPRPLAFFRRLEPMLRGFPLGAQYLALARRPA